MELHYLIAYENPDGSLDGILVMEDGFPEIIGVILITYYKNKDVVKKLISQGHCLYLSKTPELSFSYHLHGGKDWKGCQPYHFDSIQSLNLFLDKKLKYNIKLLNSAFIYRKSGMWYFRGPNLRKTFMKKQMKLEPWLIKHGITMFSLNEEYEEKKLQNSISLYKMSHTPR